MACHFYCFLQFSLVIRAGPRHSSRHYFAPFRQKLFQQSRIFIINGQIGILTEPAYPFPYVNPLLLTTLRSCWSCWSWHLFLHPINFVRSQFEHIMRFHLRLYKHSGHHKFLAYFFTPMSHCFLADTFDVDAKIAFINPQGKKDKLFSFWCVYHFRPGFKLARKKHFVH